jgi:hypothetical protein
MLKCIAAILLIFVNLTTNANAERKVKLIHFGWDNPTIATLPQMLKKFEASPFDGISVTATAHDQVFTVNLLPETIYDVDYAILAKLKPGQLSNSYLVIHSATDGVFDWTNDQHWSVVLKNIRSLARLAHRGGFKGLAFDMEPYGKSPWDYSTQPAYGKLAFSNFQDLLQKRGEDMIQAIQEEFPGLDVFCLYGLSAMTSLLDDPLTQMSGQGYGLWPAFFGGWIKAAAPMTRIIDGNEPSYYYTTAKDFSASKERINVELAQFLKPELRAAYKRKISLGQAVFVDGIMNLHQSPRFIGYYFKTDQQRLKFLQQNTALGLKSADSLVWVYAEKVSWWKDGAPKDIDLALRNAKENKRPLELVVTQTAVDAWKNRVSIGGTFADATGKAFTPSKFKPALAAAACSTWGDHGEYSCEFPKGTTIEIEPEIVGHRFKPKSQKFKNIVNSKWDANWLVE